MPEVRLNAADAAELAEMLQFLSEWLGRDPSRLGASLAQFVGHPGYGIAQLRQDLHRFTFLLGDDGESLFGSKRGTVRHVTVTSPPRGAKSAEGGGFAAARFPPSAQVQHRSGI